MISGHLTKVILARRLVSQTMTFLVACSGTWSLFPPSLLLLSHRGPSANRQVLWQQRRMRPLRGLQETRVATREESGVLGFPSRRGLTPREKTLNFICFSKEMSGSCFFYFLGSRVFCEGQYGPLLLQHPHSTKVAAAGVAGLVKGQQPG